MKKFTLSLLTAVAMTFTVASINAQTEVTPGPVEAKNAYAYDITVDNMGTEALVQYRLNATADSVKILAYVDGQVLKTFPGSTFAEYDPMGNINNTNIAVVPLADFPEGKTVTFSVQVFSPILTEAKECGKAYKFYHPGGVEVDLNPESPHYGRILVTEAMNVPDVQYLSGTMAKGIGKGIYPFEPTLLPIVNKDGRYGHTAGMTLKELYTGGGTAYDFRKVRISDDGRIFIARGGDGHCSIIEICPDDLDSTATELFSPAYYNDQFEAFDKDSNFLFAPNVSLDVRGTGRDLQLLQLSVNKSGKEFAPRGYRTDVYKLGEAKNFKGLPEKVEALSHKYTVARTNTMVEYDAEGGIWYCNSRAAYNEAEPGLVHINAAGVEDYKDTLKAYYGGGAIRFNHNNNLLYVATGNGVTTAFEVTKDETDKIKLVEKYNFKTNIGRNQNDYAFDDANNLYVVGNSDEWFKVFALPREKSDVITPAASKYSITMPESEPAIEINTVAELKANAGKKVLFKDMVTRLDKDGACFIEGSNIRVNIMAYNLYKSTVEGTYDKESNSFTITKEVKRDGFFTFAELMDFCDFDATEEEKAAQYIVKENALVTFVSDFGLTLKTTIAKDSYAFTAQLSDLTKFENTPDSFDVLKPGDILGMLLVSYSPAEFDGTEMVSTPIFTIDGGKFMSTGNRVVYIEKKYEDVVLNDILCEPVIFKDVKVLADADLGNFIAGEKDTIQIAVFDDLSKYNNKKCTLSGVVLLSGGQYMFGLNSIETHEIDSSVDYTQLSSSVYVSNRIIYVEAQPESLIEVYSLSGQKLYSLEAQSEITEIFNVTSDIVIIRVSGETHKVALR